MLILVMIVTVGLGAAMSANVITTAHVSDYSQSRIQSLDAAETGVQFVLGQLRAASSSTDTTVGDSGRLPCGPTGTAGVPWTGTASGGTNAPTYSVYVYYYSVNPTILSTADLANPKYLMRCTAAGPYNTVTQIRTPKYALLRSTGTSGYSASTTRTIETTYNFQVQDLNIPGGQIRLFPSSSTQATQWCMDAGSNPDVGTAVTLQACSTSNPPAVQQVWEYRSDLSIALVSSVNDPTVAGLCLDSGAAPTSHTAGDPILLERCAIADSKVCPGGYTPTSYHAAYPAKTCAVSPWNQQWSVDDNAHLEGAKTDQSDIDGLCINAASQAAGVALALATCAGGTSDPAQTWIPAPTTGAGMAGAGNQQLVNFQQFATCLDVTGQNVAATYMILYTCKQNPNPCRVAFNQKFIPSPALSTAKKAAPSSELLTVTVTTASTSDPCSTTATATYCLRSPQTAGGYPILVAQGSGVGQCPASVSAAGANSPFVWTMYQRYDATGAELPYALRYVIADSSTTPLCLGIGSSSDLLNATYSKAVTTTCDGSTGQKWNAAVSLTRATFTGTRETTGSTGG